MKQLTQKYFNINYVHYLLTSYQTKFLESGLLECFLAVLYLTEIYQLHYEPRSIKVCKFDVKDSFY